MRYVEGQIIAFGLRALYRFGMSLAEETPEAKRKHLTVMDAHVRFVHDCIEHLPSDADKPQSEWGKTSKPWDER